MPNENENGTMVVELGAATTHLVKSLFDEAVKRGEKDVRYVKTAEAYVEVLLDFATHRKTNEFKNDDKREVGRVLREALDKTVNGKPLNEAETKLVKAFQIAAQPTPQPAK